VVPWRIENNIKIDCREIGHEDGQWVQLAEGLYRIVSLGISSIERQVVTRQLVIPF
jgi:hypothetical protein